jgi:hypothetical protein
VPRKRRQNGEKSFQEITNGTILDHANEAIRRINRLKKTPKINPPSDQPLLPTPAPSVGADGVDSSFDFKDRG